MFRRARRRSDDCVLMYGHIDKQPEFTGWAEGLGPWTPVIRDGRLYGRGGADDGYAVFGSLLAMRALAEQNIPHARCVILIEASEESGSPDLPAYIDALARSHRRAVARRVPGCGVRQLRSVLVHDVAARQSRRHAARRRAERRRALGHGERHRRLELPHRAQLLARVEDATTGRILLDALHAPIPDDRRSRRAPRRRRSATDGVSQAAVRRGHAADGERSARAAAQQHLAPDAVGHRRRRHAPFADAGNVLRPYTALKLSFRLPPASIRKRAATGDQADARTRSALRRESHVRRRVEHGRLECAVHCAVARSVDAAASQRFFGRDAMYMGVGGTIPFMGMLGEKFPRTQFLVTGVLGPHSNAHGPNEFLHIATGKRVTACVAQVVADHAKKR